MMRLALTTPFAVAALALEGCAAQSTGQHHAATLGGVATTALGSLAEVLALEHWAHRRVAT